MLNDYTKILDQLNENKNKKIAFWGASLFLADFLNKNSLDDYNILGIIDKNPEKWGMEFGSYRIFGPDKIKELGVNAILPSIKNMNSEAGQALERYITTKYENVEVLPNVLINKTAENLDQIEEITKKVNEIKFEQNVRYKELLAANIFNNLVQTTYWIDKKDFIPTGGAATYTFLYNLFAILEYVQPKNILEFGLGQSTKLTSAYVKNKNKNAHLQVIEQDPNWLNYFASQISESENINLYHKNIVDTFIDYTANYKYEDLSEITSDIKYELIIIDGPIAGSDYYPRTNILDLIPQNLAKDFIIILDDAERNGEIHTAKLIFEALAKNGIEYSKSYKVGTKTQLLITSPNYKFVSFY